MDIDNVYLANAHKDLKNIMAEPPENKSSLKKWRYFEYVNTDETK